MCNNHIYLKILHALYTVHNDINLLIFSMHILPLLYFGRYCYTQIIVACYGHRNVVMSRCHTIVLSYCRTIILSYCRTMPYCRAIVLSHCRTIALSYCRAFVLSLLYCRTVALLSDRTVSLTVSFHTTSIYIYIYIYTHVETELWEGSLGLGPSYGH